MKIIHQPEELNFTREADVALVPTMGALHSGHLSLMKAAKEGGRTVVVSIFVNPTQFGPTEDYTKYPRQLEKDAEAIAPVGVDYIFAPSVEVMYPGTCSKISVPEVTELYEGERRPGHFDGVATIVAKLFNLVNPDISFFGLKDLQQCAVIDRMVKDLNFRTKLQFQPTVRDSDGLALSSRNAYLSNEERNVAPKLYETLLEAKQKLVKQVTSSHETLESAKETLTAYGFAVDYFDLINRLTFKPIEHLDDNSALIVAAKLGNTRLIDNLLL